MAVPINQFSLCLTSPLTAFWRQGEWFCTAFPRLLWLSPWFPVTLRNASKNHTSSCAPPWHTSSCLDKGATLHVLLSKAGTRVFHTRPGLPSSQRPTFPWSGAKACVPCFKFSGSLDFIIIVVKYNSEGTGSLTNQHWLLCPVELSFSC